VNRAETLHQIFERQALACETLGSAFTARLLRLIDQRLVPGTPVADRILSWPGDPPPPEDAVPLRLAGGLHDIVLGRRDAVLQDFYTRPDAVSDAKARTLLFDALQRHARFLLDWLDSPPQTNEVRRSAALIAAGHWLTARYGLPLVISELGASAGLNLIWDHYGLDIGAHRYGPANASLRLAPDWRGDPPPLAPPQVGARAGVDLNPIDPLLGQRRLLAYIWADQPDRLARTRAACDLAATLGVVVTRGDAIDWLEQRLHEQHVGSLHLIYHTIAWQYFPATARARGTALLERAGQRATDRSPLAHLSMEADATPGSAALTLTLWPGGARHSLGRADFHGRWLDWQAPAPPADLAFSGHA
jgi:hypothetical protein